MRFLLAILDLPPYRFHLPSPPTLLMRGGEAEKRVLERIDNPPNLGRLRGGVTREEIYEDIT